MVLLRNTEHMNYYDLLEAQILYSHVPYYLCTIMVYGYSPHFSTIFPKGNDFCDLVILVIHLLDEKHLQKWGLLIKKRICSQQSKQMIDTLHPFQQYFSHIRKIGG